MDLEFSGFLKFLFICIIYLIKGDLGDHLMALRN